MQIKRKSNIAIQIYLTKDQVYEISIMKTRLKYLKEIRFIQILLFNRLVLAKKTNFKQVKNRFFHQSCFKTKVLLFQKIKSKNRLLSKIKKDQSSSLKNL